jgi:hypothetical protein
MRTDRISVAGIDEPVTAAGLKPEELQQIVERQRARLAARPGPQQHGGGPNASRNAAHERGRTGDRQQRDKAEKAPPATP